MKTRKVTPHEWGTTEGVTSELPWEQAEERFVGFFKEKPRGQAKYAVVKQKSGCNADNANDWAVGMNSIIETLNELPDDTPESHVLAAFGM